MNLVDHSNITSNSGMPNWEKELKKIKNKSKSPKQDLFFSGPNVMKGGSSDGVFKAEYFFYS